MGSEISGWVHPPAFSFSPLPSLWSAVLRVGFLADLSAFPQGSMWRERPPTGREDGEFWRAPSHLPGGAPAPKNRGSLPPLPPPPVRRHDAPCEAADTPCRRRTGLYPGGLGQSVSTRVQCGFPGTAWTTTARASPSEREALRWSKACATWCATWVRHPPFVAVSPIRRHEGDPRRRKLSIIPRPFDTGFPARAASSS